MTAGCAVVDREKTNVTFLRSPTNEYCITSYKYLHGNDIHCLLFTYYCSPPR